MAEKDEEKKIDSGKFGSERIKEEIKKWKSKYLKDGFSDEDAQQLAETIVERGLKRIKIIELRGTDGKGGKRKKYQDMSGIKSSSRFQAEQIVEKIDLEIATLSLEIEELTKKAEKIAKKKDLYHKEDAGDIEAEREKAFKDLGDKLKLKKISKTDYDKEIQKKEEFFESIYKTRRERKSQEGLADSTGAMGFECPECHQPLFESFDKSGHSVLKCKNGHGPYDPRNLQYNGKTPWRPGIWKARETEKMADAYGGRKKRLRELLDRGDITKKEYHAEVDKAHEDVYGFDKQKHKEESDRLEEERKNQEEEFKNREDELFREYQISQDGKTYNEGIAKIQKEKEDYQKDYENRKGHIDNHKPRGMHITRGASAISRFSRTGEDYVKKVIFLVALIGIGAVISASMNQIWFFFGFLSIGLYYLTPPPEAFEKEGGKLGWDHINPFGSGGKHSGFAWVKSITKVAAIICFAYGFKSMGDVFNTLFIITCLVGYFSLKLTYSPDRPGDFIESLLRFGILGCYFIPFVVFAGIFNSYVLAAVAFAFFAIPPMPETSKGQNLGEILSRGLSGQTAYYEMFDKILFIGLMAFALLGSGVLGDLPLFGTLGWALTGTLKYTFIYFWVIALIGGFFSPARERPLTGILFLGGATIIYAVGPGSQDIGSALLGQWWPTVNQSVMSISDPISKMFGTLGKTFGDAFLLLTNPVGYATQLMNGSYSNSGGEPGGAYGIELSGFDVSPVFIEQPFMITANIKNNGAYSAEGVAIALSIGLKAPESTTTSIPGLATAPKPELTVGNNAIKLNGIGITKTTSKCELSTAWSAVDPNYVCVQNYATSQGIAELKTPFIQKNAWQTVFSSDGVKCDVAATYQLRKKSIPINVTLTYKYQSDSKVPIEFISQAEWDRLAKLDQLNTRLALVKSEYSSAPVKFPIGTPGLKNPILETQDFHIALNLMSDQTGGRIEKMQSIDLFYPKDFTLDSCTPQLDSSDSTMSYKVEDTSDGKVIRWSWNEGTKRSGDQIFFCHFLALKPTVTSASKLAGSPTKTYIITAHANYTYSNSQNKLVKVEFGSWCCADNTNQKDECASGTKCCSEQYPGQSKGKGICIPQTQNCGASRNGCCQNAIDVNWICSDVGSAEACSSAGSKFIIDGVCNQNTGRCEGCHVYDGDQTGCAKYVNSIAYNYITCEYVNDKCQPKQMVPTPTP